VPLHRAPPVSVSSSRAPARAVRGSTRRP
jgi:hypothetical protein